MATGAIEESEVGEGAGDKCERGRRWLGERIPDTGDLGEWLSEKMLPGNISNFYFILQ